ncbi:MAG: deoxyhypusine synthase family protein [Mariniphaga sp.]|jgi:deoxyhypusine synthase|nr:deoxyhypusine synthase family protein [Mariniphaga sp.]
MNSNSISRFMKEHYRHFNAAVTVDAAESYKSLVESGGKMMITLAGAMSTAELGKSLAEMIREDKVHIITCTGANLEEDVFNLIAHNHYVKIPHYRDLSPQDEQELYEKGLSRVTDTCIPEDLAFRKIENKILKLWERAKVEKKRFFPHEFIYELLLSGELEGEYQIDPKDSWLLAAAQKNLPIIVPGWEDSTLGNVFTAAVIRGDIDVSILKTGIEYMVYLVDWYRSNSEAGVGFFQIGGGIAGDFPICVVPLMILDLDWKETPFWNYFCQISDSTTSYGSYSGAAPNEKITWGKLSPDTPRFIIESDATIVAPLIFAYVLGW